MNAQKHEQVEKELERLVSVIIEVVPSLTEVRVFGSYNNGNWNPETSDIDVFVELEEGTLSIMKKEEIEKIARERINGTHSHKFSIALGTEISFCLYHYSLYRNMKSGRLLYSSQETAA